MTTAGHDPDDWFDEPDVPDGWTTRVDRLARARQAQPASGQELDDWLEPAPPPRSRSRRGLRLRRATVLLAGLGLALLLGILAAAGVFSSSHHPAAITTNRAPTTAPTTQPATTTTTAPAFAVPSTALKPGDTGAAVKQLQRALAHLGYSPGAVDGSYGSGTKDAVTRFQQAQGLTADGIAGSKTLAAMRSALQTG
jgi:hypothetical protein